jgi:aminomethyltransferase
VPLVEVVQDTVGRHDAFAMACASKYYDDIGYPGHVNCSDNFNAALKDRGVTARPGWMAVNMFFNTNIDAHGVLISDEPWSRPGDYVLLRALTDIVCVNSACPDDTTRRPMAGICPTFMSAPIRAPKSSAAPSPGVPPPMRSRR